MQYLNILYFFNTNKNFLRNTQLIILLFFFYNSLLLLYIFKQKNK